MEILFGIAVQFVATFVVVQLIALLWSRSGRPTG
jgi:hypothetical protein